MREGTLVVNPRAGGGRTVGLVPAVEEALAGAGWRTHTVLTTSPEQATRLAEEAGPDGTVITLGGDGLIALAAAGAHRSGALLAPLPAGRGNDLLRALGVTGSPVVAAAALAHARERRVDLGWVGDRPFLGVATVGYDSLTNVYANASQVRGPLVYTVAGVRALYGARAHRLVVRTDGVEQTVAAVNLAVANSGRYAGGVVVGPHSDLHDGLLEVVAATSGSRRAYFAYLMAMLRGRHLDRHDVWHVQAGRVEIDGDPALDVYADGDLVGPLPVSITITRDALRVLA